VVIGFVPAKEHTIGSFPHPVRLVHGIAADIFAILVVATLLGAGERFGF